MGLICEILFNTNNFVGTYSEFFTTGGSKWPVNNIRVEG